MCVRVSYYVALEIQTVDVHSYVNLYILLFLRSSHSVTISDSVIFDLCIFRSFTQFYQYISPIKWENTPGLCKGVMRAPINKIPNTRCVGVGLAKSMHVNSFADASTWWFFLFFSFPPALCLSSRDYGFELNGTQYSRVFISQHLWDMVDTLDGQ